MSVLVLILAAVVHSAVMSVKAADDLCPYPSQLKPDYDFDWTSKSGEWSNTNTPTDYMMLALSWSPSYCATLSQSAREKEFQCIHNDTFGLIVHGLWPQKSGTSNVRSHPRNCRNEPQLNETFIKRYFCMMPSETLIQGEWEKHGTCYYKQAVDYYGVTEELFQTLRIPTRNVLESSSPTVIKTTFLSLNSPSLMDSAIKIDMTSAARLKEVKICYDLNYHFTACV